MDPFSLVLVVLGGLFSEKMLVELLMGFENLSIEGTSPVLALLDRCLVLLWSWGTPLGGFLTLIGLAPHR